MQPVPQNDLELREAQPRETQPHKEASVAEPAPDASEPMLYCPACNNKLSQHKCKLMCDRCGYYMSCADYY